MSSPMLGMVYYVSYVAYAFILYADVAKNLTLPNSDYLCLAMT